MWFNLNIIYEIFLKTQSFKLEYILSEISESDKLYIILQFPWIIFFHLQNNFFTT